MIIVGELFYDTIYIFFLLQLFNMSFQPRNRLAKMVWTLSKYWPPRDSASRMLQSREINGFEMFLEMGRPGISKELFINQTREPITTKELGQSLRWLRKETDNIVALDIGANIGYYSLIIAHYLNDGDIIRAFEPVPENTHLLKINSAVNNFDHMISIEQTALGAKKGTKNLKLSTHPNYHSFKERSNSTGDVIKTDVIAGEEFLQKHGYRLDNVNLIRMDVEGYEMKVLEGLETIIHNTSPLVLQIEVHNWLLSEMEFDSLLALLKEAEFEIISCARRENEIDLNELDDIREYSWVELILRRE